MAITGVSKRSLDSFIANPKEMNDIQGVGPGTYSPKPFKKE